MYKLYLTILFVGLAIMGFYGFQWWQSSQATQTVSLAEIEGWTNAEREEVAESVQPALKNSAETVQEPSALMSDKMDQYQPGEEIGRLVVPSIEKGYPTYWGADEATLDQGVGMYVSEWTATPDQKRHTVLSGHRNTVFTGLDNVKKGAAIFLEYAGKRYEYKVEEMWVTDADDRTVIVDKNEATLTLTTCYPFNYIGYAPERYIIQGQLVQIQEI
ncbi:C60 family peptidase [Planococcus antarcticus DSM 14505]|uniref:C60 family peptidase n=1 Tax=Planococcus antarcticus DSM 14505 TaxID=1185653 RepID=A0AA87IJV5_9BACL|nr:class D sortase [Planococcus antarcticus]EIM05687.1 C60 family peptidase [Planococcus antarcticus DSM 14505]